jgi:DNA-binding response OmpR family regulator
MLVRAQLSLPNLKTVRLLHERLGFGSTESGRELVSEKNAVIAESEWRQGVEEVDRVEETDGVEETKVSLVRLADQLEMEWTAAANGDPAGETADSGEAPSDSPKQVDQADEARTEVPEDTVVPEVPKAPRGLEGCKVAAVGFGRQDFAGLATSMLEQRARIEFLPRSDFGKHAEFDLLLLNAASLETFKREIAMFRSVLASGMPSIVIGSRAVMDLLPDPSDSQTWDFVAKPFHLKELVWRAVSLLARHAESGLSRPLPARVVVADHDPFTRTLVESALKRLGVDCEMAEDGEAAWNSIEKSQPGAVILDLTLPNRDGFQLLADVRRLTGRKPKVIVLSARQSEADVLRAFALGADDYVTKPFSPLELSARLMRVLGGSPEMLESAPAADSA